MKYIDADKLIAEIERRLEKYDTDYTNAGSELKKLLSFITSLQQEKNCIFGNIPSEDTCSFCSAYCSLRVPKTKTSTSTEIATPSGQVENLAFEEYLRGVFEINNGIENGPDNLVRIHAPELLKLARKQERPEADIEKALDEYYKNADFGPSEANEYEIHKDLARHFYELGLKAQDEKESNQ